MPEYNEYDLATKRILEQNRKHEFPHASFIILIVSVLLNLFVLATGLLHMLLIILILAVDTLLFLSLVPSSERLLGSKYTFLIYSVSAILIALAAVLLQITPDFFVLPLITYVGVFLSIHPNMKILIWNPFFGKQWFYFNEIKPLATFSVKAYAGLLLMFWFFTLFSTSIGLSLSARYLSYMFSAIFFFVLLFVGLLIGRKIKKSKKINLPAEYSTHGHKKR